MDSKENITDNEMENDVITETTDDNAENESSNKDMLDTKKDISEHECNEPSQINPNDKTLVSQLSNPIQTPNNNLNAHTDNTRPDEIYNSREHDNTHASENQVYDTQDNSRFNNAHGHSRETEEEMYNDATSDMGDECTDSEETVDENQPLLTKIYVCSYCGWTPEMEKCSAHKSFQTGFADGLYQHQGVMHGYPNYNFTGYTAGQRPGYPTGAPQTTVDLRYNPNTNRAVSTTADPQNQTAEDYTLVIQSLRRKTFCLSIVVIFLMFGVITLAILIS